MGILKSTKASLAKKVKVERNIITITLQDDREIFTPTEWFPNLRNASPEQLSKWKFINGGEGIRWEELDTEIDLETLLK